MSKTPSTTCSSVVQSHVTGYPQQPVPSTLTQTRTSMANETQPHIASEESQTASLNTLAGNNQLHIATDAQTANLQW